MCSSLREEGAENRGEVVCGGAEEGAGVGGWGGGGALASHIHLKKKREKKT